MERAAVVRAWHDWWSLAGVEDALTAEPRGWLTRAPEGGAASIMSAGGNAAEPVQHAAAPSVPAPVPAAAPVYPSDLSAFHAWLAESADLPEAAWAGRRSLPAGPTAPSLMVVVDMPDLDDAGGLLSGEAGRLFDAMLRALGAPRDSIYLASLAVARPFGGIISPAETALLAARMRRHLSLVAPRRLLILSETAAKALGAGFGKADANGLRTINHDGGTVGAAVAHHPRFLRKHPEFKADAWAAMQPLSGKPAGLNERT